MKKRHSKRRRHEHRKLVRADPSRIKITGKPRRYIDVDVMVEAIIKIAASQLPDQAPRSHLAMDSDDLASQDESVDRAA
jgi:hypothetical protein